MAEAICPMCGLTVYIEGRTEHPCCEFARERGETRCTGCEGFKAKQRRGTA